MLFQKYWWLGTSGICIKVAHWCWILICTDWERANCYIIFLWKIYSIYLWTNSACGNRSWAPHSFILQSFDWQCITEATNNASNGRSSIWRRRREQETFCSLSVHFQELFPHITVGDLRDRNASLRSVGVAAGKSLADGHLTTAWGRPVRDSQPPSEVVCSTARHLLPSEGFPSMFRQNFYHKQAMRFCASHFHWP